MPSSRAAYQQFPAGSGDSEAVGDGGEFGQHQYNEIVRIRDVIFSGQHPSIRAPPSAQTARGTGPPHEAAAKHHGFHSSNTNGSTGPPSLPQASSRPGKVEINLIFLEKSDDLIRAELQLQRQRIERSLKEELDQRRAAKHTQPEPPSELDLPDVLARALTLVQATAAPPPLVDDSLTANDEAASDSFDDNTFYSSRHDTPESHLTSRVRPESEDCRALNISTQAIPVDKTVPHAKENTTVSWQQGNSGTEAAAVAPIEAQPAPAIANAHHAPARPVAQVQVPGLSNYVARADSTTGPSQPASADQSEDSGAMDVEYQGTNIGPRTSQQHRDAYAAIHPPSPLARSYGSPPRGPASMQVAGAAAANAVGTPAQVVALRNDPAVATSPESSSQGPAATHSTTKKTKKKKRKADRQAHDSESTTYIKPEPKSPSPFSGPAIIRPSKRQRHNREPAAGQSYPQPRFDQAPAQPLQHTMYEPSMGRASEIYPRRYEPANSQAHRAVSTTVLDEARMGHAYVDSRPGPGDPYLRAYPSPLAAANGHSVRSTPQQVVIDGPYREPPRYGREQYEYSRMSVRPDSGQYLTAPRPPPTRIYVDEYGREYIEPPPSVRQSVAPTAPQAEAEIIYERVRAPSRYPEATPYENRIAYPPSTPAYPVPRRVMTQPEYAPQEYRDVRHGEFGTTRALGPSGDYIQTMAPPDRRIMEDRSREYGSRAASVRPAETVRYELPPDYGRVQSVRPEGLVREYTARAHQEPRREFVQPYLRELSTRPPEQHVVQREYSTRPVEQYYDSHARSNEVAFIERPRGATQEIVYADDGRREMYR